MISILEAEINDSLGSDIHPSRPSRLANAGVVGNSVKTLSIGALALQTLVDVGAAERVLEASRAGALEYVPGVFTNSAVLTLVLVAKNTLAIHVDQGGDGELLA